MRQFRGLFFIASLHVLFTLMTATVSLAQSFVYNSAVFATGAQPIGVAMADFNGDGRLDLAVANSNDTTVSILLGKPDGTMSPKVDIQAPHSPLQVIAADFNDDGRMDLAVTYGLINSGNGLLIYFGNGDGTFKSPINVPVGAQPNGMAAADLNHDGKLDLVVADGGISVLLGNGDGSFKPATSLVTPPGANSVTVADLNGDGDPDLAVTTAGGFQTPGSASILLGNGDGTFQGSLDYRTGDFTASVAAADFNGDHKLDLVVSSLFEIDILLGNGDGTFQVTPLAPQVSANSTSTVYTADLNHDGKQDFVVSAPGTAYVFLGNGDGTFQLPSATLAGKFQSEMAIGDVNGDGEPDLAVTDYFNNKVALLLGNGDGTFGPVIPLPSLPFYQSFPFAIGVQSGAIADFTGDGKPDLALTAGNYGYKQGGVVVIPSNGTGALGAPIISNFFATALLPADFNEDSKMDLVFGDGNGAGVALSNGDGSFGSVNQIFTAMATPASQFVTGDFNNDHHADVVTMSNCSSPDPCIAVSLGNGDGTFQNLAPFLTGPPVPTSISAADFNRDGKLDLALTFNPSGFGILLGNGDGTFKPPVIYATTDLPSATTVDLNHDGKPDLLVIDSANNKVDVYLGNGTTTLPSPPTYDSGPFPRFLVTGDFNGDGKLDVAVLLDSGVSILYGNGDGTLQPPIVLDVTNPQGIPSVGDFNQDGLTDILVGGGTGALVMARPIISLFPSALKFAAQGLGTTSVSKSISIINVGLATVNFTNLSTTSNFAAVSHCGSPLHQGASCTIDVTFTPAVAGEVAGVLTLFDNTVVGVNSIALEGIGTGAGGALPAVTLAPNILTYQNQTVGTASVPQSVTLTNSGNAPLTIASILTNGDFSQTNNCSSSISPNGSCTIIVTFLPTRGRTRLGLLGISDNATNSPQSLKLSGTGISAHIALSTNNLDFGKELFGTTSSAKQITISNSGAVPLALTGIAVTGDFGLTSAGNTCNVSSQVAAGASCVLNLTFVPDEAGAFTGMLTLTDNDDGVAGSTQTVILTGVGTSTAVQLSPASYDFQGQLVGTSSTILGVTLSNTGSAPLSISAITATGDFSQTNNCGSSVGAGASCVISVTFIPTATDNRTGSVTVTDSANDSPQSISLHGIGEDFSLAPAPGTPTSVSIIPGQSANYRINVTAESGLQSSVKFTCTGTPSESACIFSPNPLNGETSTMVTVTTAATTVAPPNSPRIPPAPSRIRQILIFLLALASIACVCLLIKRRPLFSWKFSLFPLTAGLVLAVVLMGCGGSGSGGGGIVHHPGTPSGTYTLTITGTAGTGNATVSHSVTLTLKVT